MTARPSTVVPRFGRRFFDSDDPSSRIGDGALGGKASGLVRLHARILERYDATEFPDVEVDVPKLTILTTELFETFMEHNGLHEVALSGQPDDRIAHAFLHGEMPAEYIGDLRALAQQARQPLAVRSSSLLEDDLAHPFAGVYATKMIPNNQPSVDERFKRLVEAIKYVWASTYFEAARAYLEEVGRDEGDEKMAVVVQEIVGERRGERFYPTISGVARSYNYYPTGHARPEDGVVNLALGLGKTIVDGGLSWTYSPAYPKSPPPSPGPGTWSRTHRPDSGPSTWVAPRFPTRSVKPSTCVSTTSKTRSTTTRCATSSPLMTGIPIVSTRDRRSRAPTRSTFHRSSR